MNDEGPLQDLSRPALANAVEANLFAMFALWRQWPRAQIFDGPETLASMTDIAFPLFNSVLRARLAPARVDAAIDEALARCAAKSVPMLWWTGPATQPPGLGSRLLYRGFERNELPGMAADLQRLPHVDATTALDIEQVADEATLAQWNRVVCTGFGMPGFVGDAYLDFTRSVGLASRTGLRHYLGRLDGTPVATVSMYLGAGVAGIYNVTTLAQARGRGIAATLTRFAMRQAQGEGRRAAILHSSAMGRGVYRRLGFVEVCKIGQYVSPPPRH